MSFGFTPQQARDYDAWKTAAPESDDACDKCKLNSCDDCEHSEDWCKDCLSTDCKCKEEED